VSRLVRAIGRWLGLRFELEDSVGAVLTHPVPAALEGPVGWWYVFGSATLAMFIVQVVTGVGLAMTYVPAPNSAYESLQFISGQATLGGVLRGTVMQYQADRGFFVADVFWLPPDGDPIGPMAFTVACAPAAGSLSPRTEVRVTQQGFEDSERWRRYYEVIGLGWTRALASLKALLEK
jgi:hypothetical protein